MENLMQLFHFEDGKKSFEDYCHENGFTYWWATELMEYLGYETLISFNKVINKAMTTCNTLNIPIMDNFIQVEREVESKIIIDWKLSRFACYLAAINADNKKIEVAKAQAYFAALAGAVQNYIEEANQVERLLTRDEISEREKSLSGVAKIAGLTNYPYFQNAGYRGLYNMNITKLRTFRGIDQKKSPLDYMGKEELAANLFRITQTELKIKNEGIKGQQKLEVTAEIVGRQVRKSMQEISGVLPENLPISEDISEVKKKLKNRNKEFKKIDNKKSKKKG